MNLPVRLLYTDLPFDIVRPGWRGRNNCNFLLTLRQKGKTQLTVAPKINGVLVSVLKFPTKNNVDSGNHVENVPVPNEFENVR